MGIFGDRASNFTIESSDLIIVLGCRLSMPQTGYKTKIFAEKAKIINVNVPLKVKTYIEENLAKEIKHFKTKYKLEFNIISDNNLIVPEYKIDLLNKNNKIIKKIESIEKIEKIL